jgi:hypothetical protein
MNNPSNTLSTCQARATLFRALLEEAPIPSATEVAQAKVALNEDRATTAALDEMVDLVLQGPASISNKQRTQAEAYILAQLAGRTDLTEFAELRRALDQSVELAEEYALLFATLRAEALCAFPTPQGLSSPDLAFLPMPALLTSQTLTTPWWRRLGRWGQIRLADPLMRSAGRRPQLRLGLLPTFAILLIGMGMVAGVWSIQPHINGWFQPGAPTLAYRPIKQQSAFSQQQLELEQQLPTSVYFFLPEQQLQPISSCLGDMPSSLLPQICPM